MEPFLHAPGLADMLRKMAPDDAINELLTRKDAIIAEALESFEAQQARGAWVNEMCEKYYKVNPRDEDRGSGVGTESLWPTTEYRQLRVHISLLCRSHSADLTLVPLIPDSYLTHT